MACRHSGSGRAIFLSALLCNCGAHYEGGGDGAAGESPSAGSGGVTASGGAPNAGNSGSPSAGTAGAAEGGTAAGAGGATAGAGGASGASGPDTEPVLGCAAQSWPDAGWYYEPAPYTEPVTRRQILLHSFRAYALSANGRVAVGQTRDPDNMAFFPLSWTLSAGIAALPVATEGEAAGIKASCDGSVVLVGDSPFDGVYRVDVPRWQYPLVIHGNLNFVSMDPNASVIIDGRGRDREEGNEIAAYPRRWTAATGPVELKALRNTVIHQAAADGTLVGSDRDELFRFYPARNTREPIGMAPVDTGPESIVVSSSGYAWMQNADTHYDSFLVWRPPAEPISVTCDERCVLVDISSTGEIALLEASSGGVYSSWIWTETTGFLDLTQLMVQAGFDLRGRKLHAVAMSDDGRALTGYSLNHDLPSGIDPLFFYAVLPAAIYRSP
jgi:hypothetical protein